MAEEYEADVQWEEVDDDEFAVQGDVDDIDALFGDEPEDEYEDEENEDEKPLQAAPTTAARRLRSQRRPATGNRLERIRKEIQKERKERKDQPMQPVVETKPGNTVLLMNARFRRDEKLRPFLTDLVSTDRLSNEQLARSITAKFQTRRELRDLLPQLWDAVPVTSLRSFLTTYYRDKGLPFEDAVDAYRADHPAPAIMRPSEPLVDVDEAPMVMAAIQSQQQQSQQPPLQRPRQLGEFPWIEQAYNMPVIRTYFVVVPTNKMNDDDIADILLRYATKDKPLVAFDKQWHRANTQLVGLLNEPLDVKRRGVPTKTRTQEGSVTTIYPAMGRPFAVELMYELANNTFLEQSDQLFVLESNYFAMKQAEDEERRQQKLAEIRQRRESQQVATEQRRQAQVLPEVTARGVLSQYKRRGDQAVPDRPIPRRLLESSDSSDVQVRERERDVTTWQRQLTIEEQTCYETMRNRPWLHAMLRAVYIAPVNGDSISSFADLVHQTSELSGWYRANRNFDLLLCSPTTQVTQSGNVTTISAQGKQPFSVYIRYDTNTGFIQQDEALHASELAYRDAQAHRLPYRPLPAIVDWEERPRAVQQAELPSPPSPSSPPPEPPLLVGFRDIFERELERLEQDMPYYPSPSPYPSGAQSPILQEAVLPRAPSRTIEDDEESNQSDQSDQSVQSDQSNQSNQSIQSNNSDQSVEFEVDATAMSPRRKETFDLDKTRLLLTDKHGNVTCDTCDHLQPAASSFKTKYETASGTYDTLHFCSMKCFERSKRFIE